MTSLGGRILHAIGLGRQRLVDDSGPVQRMQIEQGPLGGAEKVVQDDVPHVGEFGFTSHPPAGSEVVVVRLAGNRSLTVVIGTNHQPTRLKGLKEGEAAIYSSNGAYVWLTNEGLIIDGAGLPALVRNVGTLTVDGDLHVTGDVRSRSAGAAVSLNGLRDAYVAHHHSGVQPGGGSTGTTDRPA